MPFIEKERELKERVMKLDFNTLYVIILLNSVSFAFVWAVFAIAYRSLTAARYWLLALVMTSMSGPLLVAGEDSQFLTYLGMTLVSGSFAINWQGIRVFYGSQPDWGTVALIVGGSLAAMYFFGESREADNVVFAVSQIVPVSLAIFTLLRARPRYLGSYVAAVAAAMVVIGQGAETVTNLLRLSGLMSTDKYYEIAAWFLVCAIIGGSVWSLGFLIMATDRFRAELRALASRDELTGLPNRRSFYEQLKLCEESVENRNKTAAVLMIDLDRFKAINDRFGHAAGDAAIIHVAKVASGEIRNHDVLARLGGDEFCILMPNTDLEAASIIAKRLNEAITSTPLIHDGNLIPISASIGLAQWQPDTELGLMETLDQADTAMFGTKRNGRDGLTVFDGRVALERSGEA